MIDKSVVNWQVKLITQAQTDLKVYIKEAVLYNYPFETIQTEVRKQTKELIDDLDSDELKVKVRQSFPQFASQCYNISQRAFSGLTPEKLVAISALLRGNATQPQILALKGDLPRYTYKYIPDDVYQLETPLKSYYKTVYKQVKENLAELIRTDAKDNYTTNVNLRNIAEMQVRYDGQLAMLNDMIDKGVRYVWIEPHANCSIRCQRWQGKLYSLNKTSGTIDGIQYRPLDDAMNATYTTKSGKVYINGCITGYNCRHRLKEYDGKASKPTEIPAKVVEKKRTQEETQRKFERAIRFYKEDYQIWKDIDPVKASMSRKKAIELNKKYEIFSRTSDVPIIRERTRI